MTVPVDFKCHYPETNGFPADNIDLTKALILWDKFEYIEIRPHARGFIFSSRINCF
jgi:hypothetical protein